jgi:hypothetical protein
MSTLGAATGIMVATRRLGPLLLPRLRRALRGGRGGGGEALSRGVGPRPQARQHAALQQSSGDAAKQRAASPADVNLLVRCLPEAAGLLLCTQTLQLACGGRWARRERMGRLQATDLAPHFSALGSPADLMPT